MIPNLILNKIYWYLWRYKQHNLCIEYHLYFTFDNNLYYTAKYSDYTYDILSINDRYDSDPFQNIRDFRTNKYHTPLPKNYFTQPILY